jgi:hypothetical protein
MFCPQAALSASRSVLKMFCPQAALSASRSVRASRPVRKPFCLQAFLSASLSDLDNKKKIFRPEICFISGL